MKALMRRTLIGLVPIDRMGEDILKKIPLNTVITCEIKKTRNIQHHRKWWALMQVVANAMPGDYDPELVCNVIKLRVGHVDVVRTRQGEEYFPKSINFASMDQLAFESFFNKALVVIFRDILPGVNSDELWIAVNDILEGGHAA